MPKIMMLLCLLLMGCANRSPSYGQDSDNYPKSACYNCQKEPFYINGHWVK